MAQGKCDQCGKYREPEGFYFLHHPDTDSQWRLCSIDCATAMVWDIRERQPKLSKSTIIPAIAYECSLCKGDTDQNHEYVKGLYVCQKCADQMQDEDDQIHTCKICGPECSC
jgi:hypothetical protein